MLKTATLKEKWHKMHDGVVVTNDLRMTAENFDEYLCITSLIDFKDLLLLLVFRDKTLCSFFLNKGREDAILIACGLRK